MKSLFCCTFLLGLLALSMAAQTTEFTFQGHLLNTGSPANGNFDFEFLLFDALTSGSQLGTALARNGVVVSNGVFSVPLDFGDEFPGSNRFLEIHVRAAGGGGFTVLLPRQQINSSPYSIKSTSAENAANATTAANALQLGGAAANQYVLTGDTRLSDARPPTAGSSDYIQNGTSQQAKTNFNIDGDGVAGTLSAGAVIANFSGFYFGSSNVPVLRAPGDNLFVGNSAGSHNTTGASNAYFGYQAGFTNTTGGANSLFGYGAGYFNTGGGNAFFGYLAGQQNTVAGENSFFGNQTGLATTTGALNSFYGARSGQSNTTGGSNAFFGSTAGLFNTTGGGNAFFGVNSGVNNVSGILNTAIGSGTGFGSNNLTNATAIGANARVAQSNSLVLGSISGVNGATADTNVGIGTTTPSATLDVRNISSSTGVSGISTSGIGVSGTSNSNFGVLGSSTSSAGVYGSSSNFPGVQGNSSTNNGVTGQSDSSSGVYGYSPNLNGVWGNSPVKGVYGTSNNGYGVYGTSNNNVGVYGEGPIYAGYFNGKVRADKVFIQTFEYAAGLGGTELPLCTNGSTTRANLVNLCGASSLRYKKNIRPLHDGLAIVARLRPISFDWKGDGTRDLGLAAEEVNNVEPLLAIHDKDNEVQGVRYDRIGVVLINAVKEQQAQIESLKSQINAQAKTIDAIKGMLCRRNSKAALCRK